MADPADFVRHELAALRDGNIKDPLGWLALLKHEYLRAKQSTDASVWQQLAAEYSRRGSCIPRELRRCEEMFALDVDEARCKMYVQLAFLLMCGYWRARVYMKFCLAL
jgi:hypothetical protein